VGCYRPDLIEAAALSQTWQAFIKQARVWQQQGRWAVMALCPTDTPTAVTAIAAQHRTLLSPACAASVSFLTPPR